MKKIAWLFIFLLLTVSLWAQLEIDREELKKGREVEFINYNGPYEKFLTFEEVRAIGVGIAQKYRQESFRETYRGVLGSFTIIHVYEPADKSQKYNADIFVIEAGAFIDHIRTLRIILAGYLQTAYGLTLDDALLVARFITLYNAVFRGDLNYFAQSYKPKVMTYLTSRDAGLALTYSEWPDKTKMLIPLSEKIKQGDFTSIDTQKLIEEELKNTLRQEPDKGIDERKQIVDFQEKQLEKKEKELVEDKKKLEEAKAKLNEEKRAIEEEKKQGLDTTDKEKEVAKKEEEIKKTEEELAQREETLKQEENKLQKDRQEIVQDEKKTTEEKTVSLVTKVDTISNEKGIFLKVTPGSEDEDGQLVLFNFQTNKKEAETRNIRIKQRRVYIFDNTLLVVAEPTGKGTSYLMYLDAKTLEVNKQSEEEIYKASIITTQGNAIFAIVVRGREMFVGKFNSALTLIARSQEEVTPLTPLVVSGSYLYAQGKDGKILRLSVADLSSKALIDSK